MDDMFSPEAGKDTIHIDRSGVRSGPYRCMFSRPKLTLWYSELDICEGDKIIRSIPGREEAYTATVVDYHQSFDGIPACYVIDISKDTALPKPNRTITTNHINIHGSTGIQIGDHNVQHLEAGLKELLSVIDKSEGEPAAKEEAKGRLKGFLEHPLTASAVGAGLPALMALFGVAA